MTDNAKVSLAIESYTDWSKPWEFWTSVTSAPGLNDDERRLMASVWETATNKQHWTVGNIPECARACEAAVLSKYPWLSPSAAKSLVNAAAYQWK